MPDDKVKLPRSSYEELCKIIKAYGRLTKPASLDEVSRLCAIGKTAISANNSFLASIDVIEGGRAKSATRKGVELAHALEHELPRQIQDNWARVVRENDFLNKMGIAVKIRGKMEVSALESHIAYSAGEAKSGQIMTGARAVVDILRAAGVLSEHEGQLVASEVQSDLGDDEAQPVLASAAGTTLTVGSSPTIRHQSVGASLHIELRIDAKPSDLDGLGEKIRILLRELNELEQGDSDASPHGS